MQVMMKDFLSQCIFSLCLDVVIRLGYNMNCANAQCFTKFPFYPHCHYQIFDIKAPV